MTIHTLIKSLESFRDSPQLQEIQSHISTTLNDFIPPIVISIEAEKRLKESLFSHGLKKKIVTQLVSQIGSKTLYPKNTILDKVQHLVDKNLTIQEYKFLHLVARGCSPS